MPFVENFPQSEIQANYENFRIKTTTAQMRYHSGRQRAEMKGPGPATSARHIATRLPMGKGKLSWQFKCIVALIPTGNENGSHTGVYG